MVRLPPAHGGVLPVSGTRLLSNRTGDLWLTLLGSGLPPRGGRTVSLVTAGHSFALLVTARQPEAGRSASRNLLLRQRIAGVWHRKWLLQPEPTSETYRTTPATAAGVRYGWRRPGSNRQPQACKGSYRLVRMDHHSACRVTSAAYNRGACSALRSVRHPCMPVWHRRWLHPAPRPPMVGSR